jgi:hypothetical protein
MLRIMEEFWLGLDLSGPRLCAESLEYPDAAIVVDMVGDADLNLFIERTLTRISRFDLEFSRRTRIF